MPVARTYNNAVWSASPAPVVSAPVEAPTPAPAPAVGTTTPSPYGIIPQQDWWKTRGGHELYDIFAKIEKENPMAARAFWDTVVGTGSGMNDLQAATIHKKFGGDMNAYNNWRNLYQSNNLDSYAGNFDLRTGKWTPGQGFNSQYVKDRTGWDVSGPWQASWDWGNYQNTLKTGLQSLPGQAEAGADSWKTYLHGAKFGPEGVTYPSVYEQAVGSGLIQGSPTGAIGTPNAPPSGPRASPRGVPVDVPNPRAGRMPAETPAPAVTAPTPVNPYPSTPVNPHGVAGGTYRYNPRAQ